VVTIAKGGTGQTTATAGFDALSPMTTAGDVIIGGASGTRTRLAIGTANQILRTNAGATAPEWASTLSGLTLTAPIISTISNSGTITVPTGTLTLATLTGSETLTNKTLTTPIIATISNTGTLTLPTSTDTLVGKATTDTLTNKILSTGSSVAAPVTGVEQMPSVCKHGAYWGNGSLGPVTGMWNASISSNVVLTGIFSSVQTSSVGVRARYVTGTTINALMGWRVNVLHTERDLNPQLDFKFSLPTAVSTLRVFFGFTSTVAAPASNTEPLNALSGVMFGYDSGVDGNWHIYQNDGTGGSDSTTVAAIAAADTASHTYSIKADNANTKFQYSYDGGAYTDINTTIPAASTTLTVSWWIECLAGSASRTLDLWYVQMKQDA
jgi:hypothetical protein